MAFDNASECTLPGASVASALTSNVAEEHRLNGSEHPTALAALGSFSFASEWLHFKHPSGRPVFSSCSASAALGQVPTARVREVDSPAARATACQVGPGDDAHKDPGSMARAAGAWPKLIETATKALAPAPWTRLSWAWTKQVAAGQRERLSIQP